MPCTFTHLQFAYRPPANVDPVPPWSGPKGRVILRARRGRISYRRDRSECLFEGGELRGRKVSSARGDRRGASPNRGADFNSVGGQRCHGDPSGPPQPCSVSRCLRPTACEPKSRVGSRGDGSGNRYPASRPPCGRQRLPSLHPPAALRYRPPVPEGGTVYGTAYALLSPDSARARR